MSNLPTFKSHLTCQNFIRNPPPPKKTLGIFQQLFMILKKSVAKAYNEKEKQFSAKIYMFLRMFKKKQKKSGNFTDK